MSITFTSEAQRASYEKVAGYLKELFGEMVGAADSSPIFRLTMGSSAVHVSIQAYQDDAVVACVAPVVVGAELTPELMRTLLDMNGKMLFGSFGTGGDGTIYLAHTLIGSTLDKKELHNAMMWVVTMADHHDDEIVKRWGGKRFVDA